MGEIASIHPTTEYEGYSFVISQAGAILGDCTIGDSIAVNGCCLTVTEFDAKVGTFAVGLSNETLGRTDLGQSPRPIRAEPDTAVPCRLYITCRTFRLTLITSSSRLVESRRQSQPRASHVRARQVWWPLCSGERDGGPERTGRHTKHLFSASLTPPP